MLKINQTGGTFQQRATVDASAQPTNVVYDHQVQSQPAVIISQPQVQPNVVAAGQVAQETATVFPRAIIPPPGRPTVTNSLEPNFTYENTYVRY